MGKTLLKFAGLFALALASPLPSAAEPVRALHSEVQLLAEQASLPAQGGALELGLSVRPDAGWHAYWANPGDAGKEPSMRWQLPDGFEVGALTFPAPKLIPFGEFNTYGFEGEVLLLASASVPAGLRPGSSLALGGKASWVVCDDELCVPEEAQLALTLPVGDGAPDPAHAELFAAARSKLPRAMDSPGRFAVADGEVTIDVPLPAGATVVEPYLFVAAKRFVRYDTQRARRGGDTLRFVMPAGGNAADARQVSAVLRGVGGPSGVRLTATRATAPLPPLAETPAAAPPSSGVAATGAAVVELLQAIAFGVLGGIVLNLMPCVFPILSMKALGLVQLAGAQRNIARASGILYTAGVLAGFAVIAALLLVLRAVGSAVGWGFQLQSPWVNLALGLGMVAIGLNLAGVFEIGTRLMGVGQQATAHGGEKRAAFLTGLLAVVVATPCTAPFMAAALGYALVQPAAVAMAVFLALGLGLALPYLALCWVPALGAALPKPGPWMALFRQVLAFPMLATALWLFWVLGKQLGASSMAVALLAALLLAFALWAFGRSAVANARWRWRAVAAIGLAACLAASARLHDLRAAPVAANDAAPSRALGKLALQPFTPALVRRYVAAEQPVFVYFTADWCISCKVNERVALATDAVAEAMNERGIEVVEGDWTTEDPTITEWLTMYGRAGVPLYLYFPRGSSVDTGVVLPQVLLPNIVIDAIVEADRRAAGRAAGVALS